jgi:hypothetical protein
MTAIIAGWTPARSKEYRREPAAILDGGSD